MTVLRLAAGFAVLAAVASPSGAGDMALPCGYEDKACADRAIRDHAVRSPAYWRREFAKPIEERMAAAPAELVEFLALDNIRNGYPNRPRAPVLAADFVDDVRRALASIPDPVKRRLERKLAGIYFVEDLGGTGYTDTILEGDSKPAGGFVVLDASVLKGHTANAWATWKENSPFKPHPGSTLVARIESDRDDDRSNAIRYILLHEMGHVLSIGAAFHPDWTLDPGRLEDPRSFPFFALSWTVPKGESRYASVYDGRFSRRKDVVYYFGARLAGDEALQTYEQLERTNFPTLYAATHPADDFAEAFASYVHTVLLGRPFEIRLHRDGKVAKVYGSCWSQPRCADKRRILEDFLGRF